MDNFTEKVVLITGGSSGIGFAAATKYAKLGANVAILARNRERLLAARERILETTGSQCVILSANVASYEEMSAAFGELVSSLGCPDILVHCAGVNLPLGTLESTVAEFIEVINVNLVGTFIVAKLTATAMVTAGKGGCILLISSVQAVSGGRSPQYSASKAGIHGLAKSLARELAPNNIRVLVLAPGATDTEFGERYWTPEVRKSLADAALMRRIASPSEIASLIIALTSEATSFMTGTVVHANGGFRLE